MKPVNKKILIISISLVLVLIVSLFAFLMTNVEDTAAAPEDTIEIKVNKVTTVSIYAFGSGVEFVSSNSNYDLYEVEVGTTVRLQAVNETRIFTDWVITETANEKAFVPDGVDLKDNIINIPITGETKDLTVTVNRRDALAEDYGKYMLDRFVIVDEYDLIALQNIIAGSNDDIYFEKYYENPETYNTLAKKDSLRKDLQYGYFLIANNFTVFNEEFTGIGTSSMPFQGIICGKNTNISKLFITITVDEATTDSHYGLFKFLGNEAVVRNLVVSTSIGVSPISGNANTAIYAGGLAAVMNKSTLIDVEVSTSISIESNLATKVYAGGLAGSMTAGSGIDSISDVVFQGTDAKWSIVSHKQNSELHSGLIAGTATDTYIKEIDIITTDLNVDLKNDAVENTYTNSKLYLGNVFGSYITDTIDVIIDDIMIMGDAGEFLKAMTTNGDAVVGGLIGYVDASKTGSLNVEKVYFKVIGTESEYTASTINPTSVGNTYAGGIFGVVNGLNVYALNGFKNRLETITLTDGSTKLEANYLFTGDYRVSSVQNGKSNATSNGKAIAGGLIGKGMFNLNGTNVEETNLALASPNASLVVEAIQTKMTSTSGTINDKEHACAALIYGSVGDTKVSMANISVYSNNTTIQTIREIGSRALGDLHTGGFISFARNGSSFENINMYLNDSSILTESLSYEAKNTNEDTNSAYCGGFAGEMLENSSLVNFELAGFDVSLFDIVGTTTCVESIQNTIPGGGNYRGENYIGGVVGRIQYVTLENCIFYGSSSDKDYIKMSGNESPDSAFCGGIVGLVRTAKNDVPSSVIGCEVIDTEVIGNATCIIRYDNPDIYIGGIIGAAYIHETNSTITVSNCRLTRTSVYALGNEIITACAGGIVGGATWQTSISISDCYVMESSIRTNVTTKLQNTNTLESTSGGILGGMKGNPSNQNVKISNCAVIDTNVDAEVNSTYTNIRAYSAGILGFMENANTTNIPKVMISNCYSNAYVTASHQNSSGVSNVYGITFNGSVTTQDKNVNSTIDRTIYKTFTYNNYSFQVVSPETGTYRIYNNDTGRYVRINRNSISSSSNVNTATTFTYQSTTGRLTYNSRFINFNGTTISYTANNGFDFRTVSELDFTDVESYTGTVSISANNSYYLKKNVINAANSLGTALGTGPFNIPNNQTVSPYNGYEFLYGFDGVGQKFYIEIIDGTSNFIANNEKDKVNSITSTSNEVSTALAHIWINAKANGGVDGNDLIIPSHEDKEAAAQNGWFIIDYVLLYSGSTTDISSDISNLETSYTKGNEVYKHYEVDGTHYIENKNNVSDRIYDNYAEGIYVETVDDVDYSIPEFTFKVYDEMFTFNADFEITHFGANYQLRFLDGKGNIIDQSYFNANYGSIELKLVQKHSTIVGEYKDKYHLEYKPNELIENDVTFYIRFIGGNNAVSAKTLFKVNLIANKLTLVGVTYADYTPPLNYYDQSGTIGTISNPYQLYVESITKFIPIFTKSNDIIKGKKYIIEDYIEKCTYSIDSLSDAHFDVHSNGELTAAATEYQDGVLTVTHKKTGDTQTVYFSSSRDITVSYSVTGADINGLTHASDSTNFYFEQEIKSNYSGVPDLFTITIGNNVYDLTENPNAYTGIEVYEKDKNGNLNTTVITDYYADATNYVIVVDNDLLTGNNITVVIEYPVVCMITFKLQCESFSDLSIEETQKKFKIIGGTTFKDYFTADVIKEIEDWAKSVAPFGYVFLGFYLVNDATSIPSYGIGFDQLCNSEYKINSSNTFYARWSYLIELVEAPGTHVKTGFNNEFMYDYVEDDFTRTIQIPINNNQGYVFRIDKDVHYIGDVGVNAYIVRIVDGNKVMTEVPIENYQDNANLYYIRPENITGYLVIMTSVGNSEVIVGEHTSSITENITPEDGIITFKYVVNHYYDEDGAKSYIFNLSNGLNYQTLNKEFVLDFYKQSTHEDLKIPDFTEIRVYYNCYVDGSTTPSNTLVGTYITHDDDRVYLTEFKKLDLETPVFGNDITFEEFLERDVADKSNYTVTEVYYFSIIPPNGYSDKVKNEMANFLVECGYCNGKAEPHQKIEYLQGVRTVLDLANPNDLSDIIDAINIYEFSKQEQIYHVIPSRNTEIKQENGSYVFVDNDTYSVYDIILTDTQKFPDFNYISLYDHDKQSILESSEMSFNIKELILKLGYRLGKLKIYGKTKDGIWEEVSVVEVTSAVYADYVIDFKGTDPEKPYPYYAFKVDNISTNEIRVMEIDVVSGTNGVLYDGPVTNFVETSVDANTSTYTLTKNIVGDSRHDGKVFMLAIQLADKTTGEIVDNIRGSIYLETKNIGLGISHKVYLDEYLGKNVGYINLSNIIKILNVKEITFDICIPNEYSIYAVQLLEVVNEYKPAQGEVRDKLINSNLGI